MESNPPVVPPVSSPSPAPPPASTIVASGTITEANPPVVVKAKVEAQLNAEPEAPPEKKRVKELETKVSELEDALHRAKNPAVPVSKSKRSVTETVSRFLNGEDLD